MADPAGADVHDRAIRLAADLQKIRVAEPGSALHVEHLRQISLLAGLADRNNITDLDVQEIGPVHELHAEPFKLVQLYCFGSGVQRRGGGYRLTCVRAINRP